MAEVFKAKILSAHGFEKQLVIKRILPHLAADKTFVAMFIDEAKLTAQLLHPKIVQVIDFGEVAGQYFIALEFIDGFDLLALLRAAAIKQIRLPIPISMFITMEVLDALDYAHNAIDNENRAMRLVHRDISPSNVFIARRGDVKLGDFGIAHANKRESKTQAGTLKGKYGYMSPEQVVGAKLDGRSDLFAVGIVFAEMLMGRRLFTAPNDLDVLLMVRDGRLERLTKYAGDLPPALDKIVKQALARRVADRFQNAGEFRDALGDLLFKVRMRVSASDVGRIAVDFLDGSPEAVPRVREQVKRWELPAALLNDGAAPAASAPAPQPRTSTPVQGVNLPNPPSIKAPAPPSVKAPAPPSVKAPAPAAVAAAPAPAPSPAPAPAPSSSAAAAAAAVAAAAEDAPMAKPVAGGESIEVPMVEDDAPRKKKKRGERERYKIDAETAAALDNLLTQPISVVDLDMYEAPLTPAPRSVTGPTTGSLPMSTPPPVSTVAPGAMPPPETVAELTAVTPMRVFSDLAVGAATGLLRFEIPSHVSEVYLVRGAPESLGSQLSGQRFGEYLAARGILKPQELKVAVAQLPNFGGKIVDTIIGLGIMKPVDVFRLLSEQVRQRVLETFSFSQGRAAFYRNLRNPHESFPLGLDPFEILGAGVLILPFEHLQRRFVVLRDLRPRAYDPPRLSPEAFKLGPTPRELWSMLDGTRTVREWLLHFQTADEQLTFLRTLYLLLETGLAGLV
jgi:serine/threonine protein kinase